MSAPAHDADGTGDDREARHPSTAPPHRRRVVGLVDTDSFAKWGAHLLSATPAHWSLELLTVATPRSASPAQLRAAFRGVDARLGPIDLAPPGPVGVDEVVARLRADPPDAVLVSCIGPVAEVIVDQVLRSFPRGSVPPRPVLLSGLPGISFPAKWKGVFLRARADLFVLHSHREVREYRALATAGGVEPSFALATLPFARAVGRTRTGVVRDSVVFAAQPSVPVAEEDRRRVIGWLVDTARAHPEWRVVVKTRAAAGEQQTHRETFPYADLVPVDAPSNLVVEAGPMSAHLDRAVALVTISSTAVLEAAARGVPALTLTDFGTSRSLINEVFVGSGLEGTADDLVHGRFGTVRPDWMTDNYFHPASDDDWADRAEESMRLRDAGLLVDRPAARRSRGGALRRAWERRNALGDHDRSVTGRAAALMGTPIRAVKRSWRALRSALRPATTTVPAPVTTVSVERLRDRDEELVAGRDAR
ncbi:DUF6716 putative glycosyltransferase [Curtobacterium sp. MCPF17_031]|uniref:DUF6716 putative glycosyltransferase n=1 Tax=Curtobacterium sp. MCPF17_031 TaxID=2175653 RepID=UPI000DA72BF2|nr:DUF6716 putative glycosyltransferase [Curtobacterium sp. MCPF17_031]PZE38349.1 hypothetical protein DEJ31_03290 [Curtobacterium sp. MCPF17_031]